MVINKQKYRKFVGRSILTGFLGGLFFIGFSYLFYMFNFIEISPKSYLIHSWTSSLWTNSWQGEIITLVLGAIISIFVAYMYVLLFKKILSLWLSIIFGSILWGVVTFIWPILFNNIPTAQGLDVNTIVSSLSLFILYGTFISYSISFYYKQINSLD